LGVGALDVEVRGTSAGSGADSFRADCVALVSASKSYFGTQVDFNATGKISSIS